MKSFRVSAEAQRKRVRKFGCATLTNDLKERLTRYRQIQISVAGRKSGQTISIPVWFMLEGQKLYAPAVQGSGRASVGERVMTPSGMVLDGSTDKISPPPAPDMETGKYEVDPAVVDHMEFYLLNYFKPAVLKQDTTTERGRKVFENIGCASCHVPNLLIDHDRRVADVETVHDPVNGIFNALFATATTLFKTADDGSGHP